jgi:hypothetical protein
MIQGEFRPGSGRPPATILPGGTDARGRIYFQARGGPPSDSAEILRLDPSGSRVDTVARIKLPEVQQQGASTENRREVRVRPIPYSGSDAWAVAGDGSLALVRVGDYHVDWIDASGGRRSGPPSAVSRVRITTREKQEWARRQQLTGGVGMTVEAINGQVSVSFARARSDGALNLDEFEWPSHKPPFDPGTAAVDRSGRLWVARNLPAGESALYDVFGENGRLVGSVRFRASRRLVGFGGRGLYAVAVDDDGQHRLERYAMPF